MTRVDGTDDDEPPEPMGRIAFWCITFVLVAIVGLIIWGILG